MADALHLALDAALIAGVAMIVMAALHDVVARTVPNELALGIAGAGLVMQGASAAASDTVQAGLMGLGGAVLAAFLVFVAAALLWRRGWMGGGDVKLLGASALLMPAGLVPMLLVATSLSGGLLSMVYLLTRRRLTKPAPGQAGSLLGRVMRAERWRMRRGGPLPYAVAIAGGAFFALFQGVSP